jgi:hypothetical protein
LAVGKEQRMLNSAAQIPGLAFVAAISVNYQLL